jgi:DNA-directed RNA polymerase specialized sigma24 family protein
MQGNHASEVTPWIADARGGSAQALEAFRNYLLLVANEELADTLRAKVGASELVQETFKQAHAEFAQFRGQSAEELVGWLRRILLNVTANLLDSFKAQKRDLAQEVSLDRGLPGDLREKLLAGHDPQVRPQGVEGSGKGDARVQTGQAQERRQVQEEGDQSEAGDRYRPVEGPQEGGQGAGEKQLRSRCALPRRPRGGSRGGLRGINSLPIISIS